MSKRYRTSSVASSRGAQEDDSLDSIEASTSSSGPSTRKRPRKQDPMELVQQVYDTVRTYKKRDGTLLCDAFIRVPKRRQEPGYYDVVSNPIDLIKVQQKLKTDEYEDIDDLQADIELIVRNARAFYKKSSHEYRDAGEMLELFLESKRRIIGGNSGDKFATMNCRRNNSSTPVQRVPLHRFRHRAQQQALLRRGTGIRGRPRKSFGRTPRRTDVYYSEDTSGSSTTVEDADASTVGSDGQHQRYEELFAAVMTATDSDNHLLHTEFQLLPSQRKYPDYYEVIDEPIDLRMIARKVQQHQYASLADMERDLFMLAKNACQFNEPGSLIYRNAKSLKRVVAAKRVELENGCIGSRSATSLASNHLGSSGKSERLRSRLRRSAATSLSAVTAALRSDDSSDDSDAEEAEEEEEDDEGQDDEEGESGVENEDDEDEESAELENDRDGSTAPEDDASDITDETPDNPKWKLFDTIGRAPAPGSNGGLLSEPFWRLPSRRFYPDYYKEIKNPMSLTQIKRKLTSRMYGTVSEVAGDLNILFENAKTYNVENSKLYKDAVKLQKVMQQKLQELLDIDQVTINTNNAKHSDSDLEFAPKKRGPKPKNHILTYTQRGRPPLKKRLHTLAKFLLDYKEPDGRQPLLAFVEKPSRKLYPDYYDIIADPIDFLDIEAKIKGGLYASVADMVRDFKTMFANCREYNEPNSPIYDDANLLEKVFLEKVVFLSPVSEKKPRGKPRRSTVTPLAKQCKMLYETVRDYKEPKGNRQLSTIFMKLPLKSEYPEYYEVIKQPMDMDRISHKLRTNCYTSLDELSTDFALVFDNACTFNEPDSQIYKDAVALQHVCQQTKRRLKEQAASTQCTEDTVPDVQATIQDLFLNLFATVYNYQDTDGRCYIDSLSELPEHDEVDGKKIRAISLDLIKRRLDKKMYKRMDSYQSDMFACLERARTLSATDSQVFEDSVELQQFFIQQRDELFRCGELLQSPAFGYTQTTLVHHIDSIKHRRQLQESLDDENNETRSSDDSFLLKDKDAGGNMSSCNGGDALTCNDQEYKVGDFVFVDSKEKGRDPQIVLIERLWTNTADRPMLHGNHYLRPVETYHVTSRKFLEREVFKSDSHISVPLDSVSGRCAVINVKQYFNMRPVGFSDEDVFVCESRYSTRTRSFKKIKIDRDAVNLTLVEREVSLEPKRVVSVYRERVEKHKDELAELQEIEEFHQKEIPNVPVIHNMSLNDGNTYYEQFNTTCGGVVKTGDFVYLLADGGRNAIAQIDTIWETRDGKSYFRGPWFLTPAEIPFTQTKLFYRQEMFLSSVEETHPLASIMGRCSVLDYNDYISCRITEIPEEDVFICASMYDEINNQVKKLTPEGLKKRFHTDAKVNADEIYVFPKIISPPKETVPQFAKLGEMDCNLEDSLDGGGPPSVGSGEMPSAPNTPITNTPVAKKKNKTKLVTGYILYSREVRKSVCQNNPESTFGEVSKIVGNDWRGLPIGIKQSWEERAIRMNDDTKAALLLQEEQCNSPSQTALPAPPPDQIFECLWDNCDYQFEEVSDLVDHCVRASSGSESSGTGHVYSYFASNQDVELNCYWRGCMRQNKKNALPFPNMARLTRHVRDMHINKGNGRSVLPESRSKNFKVSSKLQSAARPTPTSTVVTTSTSNNYNTPVGILATTPATTITTKIVPTTTAAPSQVKPQEPMFITVPPRPQRALHSEAYIKYIEGLHAENKFISPWERTLTVTPAQVPVPDPEKLQSVAAWLGPKADQHENVLNALWTLRNQLLRDSLCLQKTL